MTPVGSRYRIGHGFDAHRLVEGRPFILGGVHIPFRCGPLGHSDADVLCHAIADAVLGAASLGSLGELFPATDLIYCDANSLTLLANCMMRVAVAGYEVVNLDATVILEEPRLAPFYPEMRRQIAEALQVGLEVVSIKAKTTDGMGYTGDGSGIASHAVILLQRLSD